MIRRTMSNRRAAAALVAAAAAAVSLGAGADASLGTTQPEPIINVRVVLTNTGVKLTPSETVRGSLVLFKVQNTSASSRDFFIGGYIVRGLKPGGVKRFQLQFLTRGSFGYFSAAHPGKWFTGSFLVT